MKINKNKMRIYITLIIITMIFVPQIAQAEEIIDITFPIEPGYNYNFSDTYGAPRSGGRIHIGTDVMVDQMTPLVATVDGKISYLVDHDESWGLALYLQGDDGYSYRYLHINNDTPGTDDGKEIRSYAFPRNIKRGVRVKEGQIIAFAGDSGNAEWVADQLHFEIWTPSKKATNPYPSLMAAIDDDYKLEEDIISSAPKLSSYQFARSLKLGDRGEDVLELQKYLNLAGFTIAASGAGSRGSETTYFGPATQSALIKYQKAQSISPAVGYFGPITIAKINSGLNTNTSNVEVPEEVSVAIQAGWLVKQKYSPKVYYLDDLLNLRWLTTEAAASSRFGATWAQKIKEVDDLSDLEIGKDLN